MMRTPEDFRLLAGREFSELLGSDPELKRLDALKYDKAAETRVLLEVLGASRCYIGELPVMPLTAARWAFLWMLECPFVTGGTLDAAQLDATLYVMSLPDLRKVTCGLSELPGAASGYAAATGASPEEICEGVRAMIHTAFLPLSMLPPGDGGADDEASRFDGLWATRIAGIAVRESGTPFEVCLHEMSLSCACCLYVNWLRRESLKPQEIRRRPNAEIEELIDRRVEELADEFLQDSAGCRTGQTCRTSRTGAQGAR